MEMRPSWAFLLFVFLGWVLGGALRRVWRKSRPILLGILNMQYLQCTAGYKRYESEKSYQKHYQKCCLDKDNPFQDNLHISKIKYPSFAIIHEKYPNYSKLKAFIKKFAINLRFKGINKPRARSKLKKNAIELKAKVIQLKGKVLSPLCHYKHSPFFTAISNFNNSPFNFNVKKSSKESIQCI